MRCNAPGSTVEGGSEMKRRTKAMLAVSLLALSATATADLSGLVGIWSIWTGTYIQDSPGQNLTGRCPATGCVGDLVTCRAFENITITKKTLSFVGRVCGDRDESLPPCAGRITALIEECAGPDDVTVVGSLTTVESRGRARFCLDSGDCTGSAPAVVLGVGTVRTQTRFAAGASSASGVSSVVGKGTEYTDFRFDRDRVRFFHGQRLVDFMTVEPNSGGNCDGGCAVAGVSVTDQT